MFYINGNIQPSHLSNFVTLQGKISISQQGSFQYFHFTKYNTKQVHTYCFKLRDKFTFPFIKLVTLQAKISVSGQGLIHYCHYTEYKIKQVHIMFSIKGHIQPCHLSNFVNLQAKISISRQGSFQYINLPNTKPNTLTSCFKSSDSFNLPIYQTL